MKRTIVAFSGGAANGGVQVYPAEKLHKEHWGKPGVEIHGGSVGALTAAMWASNQLKQLRYEWEHEVKNTGYFQTLQFDIFGRGIHDGLMVLNPLRRRMKKYLKPGIFKVPCYVHSIGLGRGKYTRHALHKMSSQDDILDAVIASATMVGVHELTKVNGRWHGDNGFMHVLPRVDDTKPGDVLYAVNCTNISDPFAYDHLAQDEIDATRGLQFLIKRIKQEDYQLLKEDAARGVEVWNLEPKRQPGDGLKVNPQLVKYRLNLGVEAWKRRYKL